MAPANLTPLDEIRARTKSAENSKLRSLTIEPDPVIGINAVMLAPAADVEGYHWNILEIMSGPTYETPVVKLETAHQIVSSARDAKTLMLMVDTIRAKFESDARQLQATSAQLSREALRPGLAKSDRQAACEESERYRNYSTWADSVVRTLDKTIAEILNPKEDTPNE